MPYGFGRLVDLVDQGGETLDEPCLIAAGDAGNGRLKALVVPDYEQADTEGVDKSELPQIMQNNLKELNAQLAAYEQVSDITIYPTEFEKTPKRSIKRYLYAPSLLNK